jgi:hypothetical protein
MAIETQAQGSPGRREIDLHRRVCVVRPDTIDIRPARSAAVAPLLGFLLGVLCFVAVLFWLERIPFPVALALMFVALILVPFSGMGFVYSIYGANVVINRTKRTALWQQGLFGMGVGTSELVPFEKVEQIEVEEISSEEQEGGQQDFAQFEVRLLKRSGKRLELGQITVPRYLEEDGLERAREVGEAVAAMVERPLVMAGEAPPEPGRRRRRRGRA